MQDTPLPRRAGRPDVVPHPFALAARRGCGDDQTVVRFGVPAPSPVRLVARLARDGRDDPTEVDLERRRADPAPACASVHAQSAQDG